MYREHFGLKELPFSIAPDPRYLYMSDQHREALAHLVYGINSDGGFVLLTGEVGTGKTTVCRCLLGQIPENFDVAFILNPKLTAEELLATICDELGIRYPERNTSVKVFVDFINAYLLDAHAKGRKTVLIIEEAQNLNINVLEQVRLLTNLETSQCKLLQIIMLGQPELKRKLSQPELRQLAQRITARYHLSPLSKKEIGPYVNHRLSVAGAHRELFSSSLMGRLFSMSSGIPRLINVICDRALLGTYVQRKERVDKDTLLKAAREVFGEGKVQRRPRKMLRWVLVGFLFTGILAALAAYYYDYQMQPLAILTSKPVQQAGVSKLAIEPQRLSLANWLADGQIHCSKEMAYISLLERWNITYRLESGSACEQAQAQGLGCLDSQGSFSSILHLNRPAMLKFSDEQGREFYATVTELKGQTATMVVGTETRIVDVKEIEQRWLGDYTLLWKMPPDYKGPLLPGQKGKVVQWLDKQLSLIQGRTTRSRKNPVYNDTLVKEVKKFQLAKGLVSDGVVGPQTIIHLNTEAGSGEPLLIVKQEGR